MKSRVVVFVLVAGTALWALAGCEATAGSQNGHNVCSAGSGAQCAHAEESWPESRSERR
jgi:hypothetical protein